MAWAAAGSLKGPQGIEGLQGVSGPAGPAGADGLQGIQGIEGAAGTGINFRGQVSTAAELPASADQGDAYIVQADDSLQVWDATSSSWVSGGSIQGPQGIAGAQGSQGIDGPAGSAGERGTGWFNGTGAPAADIPGAIPGDLYLDNTTGDVYTLS